MYTQKTNLEDCILHQDTEYDTYIKVMEYHPMGIYDDEFMFSVPFVFTAAGIKCCLRDFHEPMCKHIQVRIILSRLIIYIITILSKQFALNIL
jgi:hypothetical protein